ncbi:antitoxin VapB36 [Mycolicibacterium sp. F2034L]|uniref:antitoxin VapB36 n=1 Tax=Mycolicibacterium sp. F2034L TaxID=2926422 RepID=UPI001FF51D7E|nr:antitoxin VapB36 [Mycolicibacterium sp. F2034L]MCK0175904.1 antitoxin VapB36 [Mycolicibacterium sp. F2034L]
MDDDVDALADELARRLHLGGRSEAILFALRASLAAAGYESLIRRDHLLEVMNSEIWPLLDDREPISKDERENILGLNPSTGA